AVAPTTAMTRVPIPLVCPHPGGDVVTHLEGGGGVAQVRGEGTRGRRPGQHLPGGPAGHEELLVAAGVERGPRGGGGGGRRAGGGGRGRPGRPPPGCHSGRRPGPRPPARRGPGSRGRRPWRA